MLQKLLKSSYIDKTAVDVRDKYGRTPLIFAVLGDHPDCVEILLKVSDLKHQTLNIGIR